MLRWTKWIAPVAAMALMVGLQTAQTRADDAATPPALTGKATITVTVVDSDGKPVSGATVSLLPARARRQKGGGGGAGGAPGGGGGGGNATTQPDGAPPAPRGRPTPLETGTTGADGTFALTNVPNGTFQVTARLKGTGAGQAKVTVADDKDQPLSVTLKARKAKAAAPAN